MLQTAWSFFSSLDMAAMVAAYWYFFLFELPRYTLSSIAVGFQAAFGKAPPMPPRDLPISVLLVGHNEADGIEKAIGSLREQTMRNLQIVIVDDGSSDGMAEEAMRLKRDGLIDTVLRANLRGGKAAGLNLGLAYCRHEYVVVADVDSSFDRDALAHLLAPLLDDPHIGAVSGNIAVRNTGDSLLTRMQAIEYFSNISLGRQFTSMFGWVMTVSGAFGAFRTEAIRAVGGWDVGPGDDSNLTTKLRRADWHICFAPHAWCLTNVPVTHAALWRQRLRWNRSHVRNRLRKYAVVFNPFDANFSLRDMLGSLNQLWFHLILTFAFAFYLAMTVAEYSAFAFILVLSIHVLVLICDFIEFGIACIFTRRPGMLRLLPYLPIHGFYTAYYMRINRLQAYLSELIFRRSYEDPFYPAKVREAQDQF